jgi:hypothetical protein
MFKIGDEIVCINNVSVYGNRTEPLVMYHKYTVKEIVHIKNARHNFISIVPNGFLGMGFNQNRFVHLDEYRRMKINKIKKEVK